MKFAPRSHLEREGGAIIAGLLFVRCEEGLGRAEGAGGRHHCRAATHFHLWQYRVPLDIAK